MITTFPELAFHELLILLPSTFMIATMQVTLPVLEFSIAILLVLAISKANLVALIGQVSVNFKSMPEGLSNLNASLHDYLCYRTNHPSHWQNHYPTSHAHASKQAFWI